jgi:hypothetical protein
VGSGSDAHHKKSKLKRTGRHRAPSKTPQRLGIAAPAIVALGAAAVWQFSPSVSAYAATGVFPGLAEATSFAGPAAVSHPARAVISTGRTTLAVAPQPSRALVSPSPAPEVTAVIHRAVPVKIAVVKPRLAAAATPKPKPTPTAALTCSGTGGVAGTGMLPDNYATIVNFLTAHGYTAMAAVGIAGNIYQESGGNPESVGTGGGGLIGFTPLPAGYVTGNPAADLQTQLQAILTYNQQWAAYIPALNAATTPTDAAYIYMIDFERPGLPAAYNREDAAEAVAQACGIGT